MSTNMSRVEQRELSVRLATDALSRGVVTSTLLELAEVIDAFISRGVKPNGYRILADTPEPEEIERLIFEAAALKNSADYYEQLSARFLTEANNLRRGA